MRMLFFAAAAALLLAAPVAADTAFSSPPQGSPERKAILDALRPSVELALGKPVEFVVEEIRQGGGWAFVRVTPQRPGGGAIRNPNEEADGVHAEAVLRLQDGRWAVAEHGIGSTDVWWVSWCDRAPKGLLGTWCEG